MIVCPTFRKNAISNIGKTFIKKYRSVEKRFCFVTIEQFYHEI